MRVKIKLSLPTFIVDNGEEETGEAAPKVKAKHIFCGGFRKTLLCSCV